MRRSRQGLDDEAIAEILNNGTSGTLALIDEEGLPYAVPLSYVYWEGKLYFHCAKEGHKIQAVRANPAASFCVIAQDDVIPEQYTTNYRSVIACGSIHILEDEAAIDAAIRALGRRYAPNQTAQELQQEIDKGQGRFLMLELTPERLTGKQGRGLVAGERR